MKGSIDKVCGTTVHYQLIRMQLMNEKKAKCQTLQYNIDLLQSIRTVRRELISFRLIFSYKWWVSLPWNILIFCETIKREINTYKQINSLNNDIRLFYLPICKISRQIQEDKQYLKHMMGRSVLYL